MSTLPVRLLLALAVVLAGAAVPAGAQSETPTTPVGDDDFAGNFGLNLLLLLGGGFLVLAVVLLGAVEAVTPDAESADGSDGG
jgi:hypothetical protein